MVSMFRAAAGRIRENVALLTKLDSVGGDGDHGTTILRAVETVERIFAHPSSPQIGAKDLLEAIGWAVMGVDGGATGPLLGTFIGGMAEPAAGKSELNARDLAAALEAGLMALQQQTKARVGDKTMMDALVPAVAAAREAANGGGGVAAVLQAAAEAATHGAESTSKLAAKFGRAKNIGTQSIGSPDAGATSISFIFRGLFEGFQNNG